MKTYQSAGRLTEKTPAERMRYAIETLPAGRWPDGWPHWKNTREAMAAIIDDFALSLEDPDSAGEGRGIVTLGGGPKYFPSAYVMARRVRDAGCTLPIELWHLGHEEMDPAMARAVEPFGVRVLDASALERAFPWRVMGGWQAKPFVCLHSAFAEVLFLDADSVPAYDPTGMFDEEAYRSTGAAFWPDYDTWHLHPHQWGAFGLKCPDDGKGLYPREKVAEFYGAAIPAGHATPFESGQFLIDKRRRWRELRLAGFLAEHSDYTFHHVHGDKECFRLAWHKLGSPYGMPPWFPGWESHTIIQYGFGKGEKVPMFYHRTADKLRLDGKNRASAVPDEARQFELARELSRVWGGTPWLNGRPTATEEAFARTVRNRMVGYHRLGWDKRQMGFLSGGPAWGPIGRGAARLEKRWSVFEDRGRMLVAVTGEDGALTFAAEAESPERLRGHWLKHERMAVELCPLDEDAAAHDEPPEKVKDAGQLPGNVRVSAVDAGLIRATMGAAGLPTPANVEPVNLLTPPEGEPPPPPVHDHTAGPDPARVLVRDLRPVIESAADGLSACSPHVPHAAPPPAGKRPRVGILMPAVLQVEALLEMTYRAVGLIASSRADLALYLMVNRLRNLDGLSPERLRDRCAELAGVPVRVSVADRTVAGSWNEAAGLALADACDRLLIMANDAFLKADTIDTLLAAEPHLPRNCVMWSGTDKEVGATGWEMAEGIDFTLAMFRPETLAKYGWFDTHFRPAYFEDNDYHARIALGNDTVRVVRTATFLHYGSATVRTDPEMAHHRDYWWEKNKDYFASKWGRREPVNGEREMRQQYFKRPFNDQTRPLWWWDGSPDPVALKKGADGE